MSDMENSVSLRRSPMGILGLDLGWIRNKDGPDWRFRHGYDTFRICSIISNNIIGV